MIDISIVIPCHNLERYIEKCLRSILQQDYDKRNYEILMIFDACTDKTEELVKICLKGSGANYKIFHTLYERAGLARNMGIENAVGRYLYFMDGDDYLIDNRAFIKLVKTIQLTDCTVVYQEYFQSDEKVIDNEAIWRYFYKREIVGETRFSSAKINEDWEFVRKIKRKVDYKEGVIYDALYHYTYPRDDSLTAQSRFSFSR